MLKTMSVLNDMVNAVQEAVDKALGVNLLDMFVQIGATILLVLIVKKFFWSKVTDFLEKRRAYMDDELRHAEKSNEEAKHLALIKEKELQELKDKSKEYLESAKKRGEDEKQQIISQAKREAEVILTNGQKEIEAEKKKAKEELQKEIVSIASLMAEKVIGKHIDDQEFQKLTLDQIERSEEL